VLDRVLCLGSGLTTSFIPLTAAYNISSRVWFFVLFFEKTIFVWVPPENELKNNTASRWFADRTLCSPCIRGIEYLDGVALLFKLCTCSGYSNTECCHFIIGLRLVLTQPLRQKSSRSVCVLFFPLFPCSCFRVAVSAVGNQGRGMSKTVLATLHPSRSHKCTCVN
jgi:hypothetical protein